MPAPSFGRCGPGGSGDEGEEQQEYREGEQFVGIDALSCRGQERCRAYVDVGAEDFMIVVVLEIGMVQGLRTVDVYPVFVVGVQMRAAELQPQQRQQAQQDSVPFQVQRSA
jgi:hypothetical protein